MSQLLTAPEQATPEWLTTVLRQDGQFPHGYVTDVRISSTEPTSVWTLFHLQVRYSADAPPSAREHLILKLSKRTGQHGDTRFYALASGKEVFFYTNIAATPAMANVPIIRCFHSAHSSEEQGSHVLVEDLSHTHWQPPLALPPHEPLCEQTVRCLASLHAAWWQDGRLGDSGDIAKRRAWELREAHKNSQRSLMDMVAAFIDYLGDRLSPKRRRVYERLLTLEPALRERQGCRPQTLLHGDAHWWNFLYPLDPEADTTRILDWGSWRIGVGTNDLAYMLALHFFPQQRRRLEERLVRAYHRELLRCGVTAYDWSACWEDYRLSVVGSLSFPAQFWALNVPASEWWAQLECGMSAFEDLRCTELLAM